MKQRYEWIKETLLCAIESQLCDLSGVDAKELGEVVDMVKDLEEAMYYCAITKAMEESEENDEERTMYYTTSGKFRRTPMRKTNQWDHTPIEMREMSWDYDSRGDIRHPRTNAEHMEHEVDPNGKHHENGGGMNVDEKMGRSPMSRKMYMEGKESHKDKTTQMRELEKYVQELAQDIVEMVEEASPEEKQYLSKKISALSTKLAQTNG